MDLTDESLALAREAVIDRHWAWMPGMRIAAPAALQGLRVVEGSGVSTDALPDFADPATVGCLLSLVQRVLGHDGESVVVEVRWTAGTHRVVRWRHRGHMGWSPMTIGGESHPSAVAALVAALKAAP